MPCWTVQESVVNLMRPNQEILARVLESLGYRLHVNDDYAERFGSSLVADRFRDRVSVKVSHTGELTVCVAEGSNADLHAIGCELKRAYSAEIIRTASKRFGWNVTAQSETKFQVRRRF